MRRTLVASLLLTLAGCSLVMDTSPPDPIVAADAGGGRRACSAASQCDDANPCNGVETCGLDGFCVEGDPVVCPSNGCLVGRCLPDGSCEQKADVRVCDDAVACTTDHCGTDGSCTHQLDDTFCDDGIACTKDLCLGTALAGLTGGCYSLPQDSACDQPTNVSNACVAMACDPVHNDPSDATGCVARPLGNCEGGTICDFDTMQCTALPDTCAGGCDDGNPCNGVETCDTTGTVPVCVSTGGCPDAPTDACHRTVCGEGDTGPYCATAFVYTSTCLRPLLP